jgi:hypothetical protein
LKKIKISNEWGVPNQFVIWADNMRIFQSYNSVIAIQKNGKTTLDVNDWDFSNTTGKYRNKFLNEDLNTTRAKIKSGEYKLKNLN